MGVGRRGFAGMIDRAIARWRLVQALGVLAEAAADKASDTSITRFDVRARLRHRNAFHE
jgi:hypothetical protein